jgi:hypothetical protein
VSPVSTAVLAVAGEESWQEEGETPPGFDVYSPACVLDDQIYFFGTSGTPPWPADGRHVLSPSSPVGGS